MATALTSVDPAPQTPPEIGEELTLFGYWGCPFVQRVWISLNLKEIGFNWCPVDSRRKPEWYSEVITTGKVPGLAFKDTKGKVVTLFESLVIMDFLDEGYPESQKTLPSDAVGKARARILALHCEASFGLKTRSLMTATTAEGALAAAKEMDASLAWMDTIIDELDAMVPAGGLSYVDISMAPFFIRAPAFLHWRGYDMKSRMSPRVAAWYDRIIAHPAVAATCVQAPGGADYPTALVGFFAFVAKAPVNYFSEN